jgi:hypothetical protein
MGIPGIDDAGFTTSEAGPEATGWTSPGIAMFIVWG